MQDPFDFDEDLLEEQEFVRPVLTDVLVEDPEPPAPPSKISRPLARRLGKGPHKKTTPVAIRLELRDFKRARDSFDRASDLTTIRHQIPTFGVYSATLPNEFILAMETDDGVKRAFFDGPVQFPGLVQVKPQAATQPGARFRRIRSRLGQFVPSGLNLLSGGVLGQKVLGERGVRPEWLTTTETRDLLGADRARADGVEGTGVKVAVLDTGVPLTRRNHPQLGMDVDALFWTRFPLPDRSGHGSHVASIIGGEPYTAVNGAMLEGMAPGAQMAGVKVLETPLGIGRDSDILKGLEIAQDWGAQIINMSLGSDGYDPDNVYEEPFAQLVQAGIIPIAAVGNSGPGEGTVGTPAGSPNCIAVGSINSRTGKVAQFSARGPTDYTGQVKPDVVSYGGDNAPDNKEFIYSSTSRGSTMDKLDRRPADLLSPAHGTSQATPHFAGVVTLWADWANQNLGRPLTFGDVKNVLRTKGGQKTNDRGVGLAIYDWVKMLGGF